MSRRSLFERMYPELADGGLVASIERRVEVPVKGLPGVPREQSLVARASYGGRAANITLSSDTRAFVAELWARGVSLAVARTDDFAALVSVLRRWFLDQVTLAQLDTAFVRENPGARAFEAGAGVEWTWTHLVNASHDHPRLADLVRACAARPRLRAMMPVVTMDRLQFSRTTGQPYATRGLPSARVSDEGITLMTGQSFADAEAAADALAAALPETASAVDGTADDV